MPTIITLDKIKSLVQNIDIIDAMKQGFIAYSDGHAVVPPVGELILEDPPGDVHIKYGYIKKDEFYVIKIASGFYDNPKLGIPSGQGLMLLFDQKTGQLECILLDEGHLTDIRTAAAGALAVHFFAPEQIETIGIIGTGVQAKLQLLHIQEKNPCKKVWLWGRNQKNAEKLKSELGPSFEVHIASSCAQVAQNAKVIITTTPSEKPLLKAKDIQKGSLIIAVGSDTHLKQELEAAILAEADLVIADSLPQSENRGEIYQAVKFGVLNRNRIIELGAAIRNTKLQAASKGKNIVVDLTGVAVQDIMISTAVFQAYKDHKE